MYPVIYLNCDLHGQYNKYTFFSRIRDSLNTTLIGESFIKELGLKIAQVRLPPNFNKKAYMKNVENSKRFVNGTHAVLSPKTLRLHDYRIFNSFQKELMYYGVVKSIQLILRTQNNSIKNGCILIYDPIDDISIGILHALAKQAKYIILLSSSLEKMTRISDYVAANYGVVPVVTNDVKYALDSADFMITSKAIQVRKQIPTWFVDNSYIPSDGNKLVMNDVSFNVPWDTELSEMSPELLGGILSQMEEKDVERSLKYNGICFDKVKFNDKLIEI